MAVVVSGSNSRDGNVFAGQIGASGSPAAPSHVASGLSFVRLGGFSAAYSIVERESRASDADRVRRVLASLIARGSGPPRALRGAPPGTGGREGVRHGS